VPIIWVKYYPPSGLLVNKYAHPRIRLPRKDLSTLSLVYASNFSTSALPTAGIIRWLWLPLNGGGIRGTHFLSLCFLNQSIASLGHAGTRRSIRGSSVKIGVTKGDVSLSLLK
jgi:hypothetical protein